MQVTARGRKLNASSIVLSIVALILLCEIGLRIVAAFSDAPDRIAASTVPLHVPVDSPELFRLNPEHPHIGSQGLRNREIPFLKPRGTRRILLLGDSVAYGPGVDAEEVFAARLEALLGAAGTPVDVINAGVPGYTPYNELQFYRSRGHLFDADTVVVVFCVDDVANPRLHWRRFLASIEVPNAAVPNPRYDRDVIQPRIALRSPVRSLMESSHLLRMLNLRAEWLRPEGALDFGADPPTFITPEDNIRIEVLGDERSPEWQWLVRVYEQIQTAVESDGAELVIAVAPIAYQLGEGGESYPYSAMVNLAGFCERRSIPCVDLSKAFSGRKRDEVFLSNRSGEIDFWNLNAVGHELVANYLAEFFEDRRSRL